jgi:hypothetical protein
MGPWVHETTSDLGMAHRLPVREVTAGEIETCSLTAGNQNASQCSVNNDEANLTGKTQVREARLKAEFAHLYPPLDPGRWEPAAAMADRIVAWLLRQPDRGYMAPQRVLRSDHFEFRGGPDQPDSRA